MPQTPKAATTAGGAAQPAARRTCLSQFILQHLLLISRSQNHSCDRRIKSQTPDEEIKPHGKGETAGADASHRLHSLKPVGLVKHSSLIQPGLSFWLSHGFTLRKKRQDFFFPKQGTALPLHSAQYPSSDGYSKAPKLNPVLFPLRKITDIPAEGGD